jgi:hypothetical protein
MVIDIERNQGGGEVRKEERREELKIPRNIIHSEFFISHEACARLNFLPSSDFSE